MLNAANTYTGPTTVSAGTLVLGAANAISGSSPVVLAGGTLNVGNFSPSLGTLKITNDSTIALGSGTLNFAVSSGVTWTAGKTLTLTGTLGATSLKFGNSASALDVEQVALIRYEGGGVHLDADGYVVSNPRGSVMRFR